MSAHVIGNAMVKRGVAMRMFDEVAMGERSPRCNLKR
jgi:hypothetical protein